MYYVLRKPVLVSDKNYADDLIPLILTEWNLKLFMIEHI